MINDSKDFKIIHHGYGAFTVYSCTVKNALRLLESHMDDLGQHIKDAAEAMNDKTRYIVNTKLVVDALNEIFTSKVGQEIPRTARLVHGAPAKDETTPTMVFEAEHLTNIMAWAMENGVAWTELNTLTSKASYDLESLNPKGLFLLDGIYKRAGDKVPLFLEGDTIELAKELSFLQKNTWKDTAKVSSVVQRYLTFISEHMTHRDSNYDLGRVSNVEA